MSRSTFPIGRAVHGNGVKLGRRGRVLIEYTSVIADTADTACLHAAKRIAGVIERRGEVCFAMTGETAEWEDSLRSDVRCRGSTSSIEDSIGLVGKSLLLR